MNAKHEFLLDICANITLVASLCVIGAALTRSAIRTDSPGLAGGYITGVSRLVCDQSEMTVLFLVSPSCPYCTRSMPSLRNIARAATLTAGRVRTVAVTPGDISALQQYLQYEGLSVDRLVRDSSSLAEYVPRILLVDRNGRVRGDWLGRAVLQSHEVIAALGVSGRLD